MNKKESEKLRKLYAQLVGINRGIYHDKEPIQLEIVKDYNSLVDEIASLINENLDKFKVPKSAYDEYWGVIKADGEIVIFKIDQLTSYLEIGLNLDEKIKEVNLVNAVKDQELKDRCLDLLTTTSKFDIVINQATLILEDRIRTKSAISEKLEGVNLVNTVLNPNFSKTILKVSDNANEQQGFCDICRGVMLSFRNITHHHITDKFSKEDALKFCGFVDVLLEVIDKAKKTK